MAEIVNFSDYEDQIQGYFNEFMRERHNKGLVAHRCPVCGTNGTYINDGFFQVLNSQELKDGNLLNRNSVPCGGMTCKNCGYLYLIPFDSIKKRINDIQKGGGEIDSNGIVESGKEEKDSSGENISA